MSETRWPRRRLWRGQAAWAPIALLALLLVPAATMASPSHAPLAGLPGHATAPMAGARPAAPTPSSGPVATGR